MEKKKRITLNAEKRKVIADVFQDHFESNSKFKKKLHTESVNQSKKTSLIWYHLLTKSF